MFSVIIDLVKREPVRVGMVLRSLVLLATTFGLELTAEQISAVMIVLELVLGVPIRNSVVPNVKVDEHIMKTVAFQSQHNS